jgi:hypothetical protein
VVVDHPSVGTQVGGQGEASRHEPREAQSSEHPNLSRNSCGGSAFFICRQEQKFEVGAASAAYLREEISRQLPLFEFYLGYPHTHITTIYFDTVDRTFYRRAEQSYENSVKIRTKEYYYRDRDGGYLTFPHCFVELKQHQNGTVHKRRFQLPKESLHCLVGGEDVWDAIGADAADQDHGLKEAYAELRGYLLKYQVAATSIVNYRRTVYQRAEEELRITFDDEIAVYPAYPGLYLEARALTREVLEGPTRRYEKVILEIKCPAGDYPEWLKQALRNHSSKRLSKFITSVRFLSEAAAERDGAPPGALGLSPGSPPPHASSRDGLPPLDDARSTSDPTAN